MAHVQSGRSINWRMGWQDEKGPFPSRMVETIASALQKQILDLNIEDVRLLISQDCALEYAVPVALEFLVSRPMVDSGNYVGDLLLACLNIKSGFWNENSPMFKQLKGCLSNLRTIDKEINARIKMFLDREIEPTVLDGRKKKTKGAKP